MNKNNNISKLLMCIAFLMFLIVIEASMISAGNSYQLSAFNNSLISETLIFNSTQTNHTRYLSFPKDVHFTSLSVSISGNNDSTTYSSITLNGTSWWSFNGVFDGSEDFYDYGYQTTKNYSRILYNYIKDNCGSYTVNCTIPFIFYSNMTGNITYAGVTFNNRRTITSFPLTSQNYSTKTDKIAFEVNLTRNPLGTPYFPTNRYLYYYIQLYNFSLDVVYTSNNYYEYNPVENTYEDIYYFNVTVPNYDYIKWYSVQVFSKMIYDDTSSATNTGSKTYTTVNNLTLGLCDATLTNRVFNFTSKDELLGIDINMSFNSYIEYWSGSGDGTYKNNVSIDWDLINRSDFGFCINSASKLSNIKIDLDSTHTSTNYFDRTYYLNDYLMTNSTPEIFTLYFLNDSLGTKFYINVKKGLVAFSGATITIDKYFDDGSWQSIGIRETDENGEFIEYLYEDKNYRFKIEKDGVNYGYYYRTAICSVAPCEMTIDMDADTVELWEGYTNIYDGNFQYTLNFNSTSDIVTFDYTDLLGTATNTTLWVYRIHTNTTREFICLASSDAIVGTITCDLTGFSGDFVVETFVLRASETKKINFITFTISTQADIFGLEGVLLALFLIITIAFVGVWSPSVAVFLTMFGIIAMKITGFLALGWEFIIIIIITGVILMVKMKI